MKERFFSLLPSLFEWAIRYGLRILLALLLWFFSFRLINWFCRRLYLRGQKKKADKTVLKALVHTLRLSAKGLVLLCIIAFLGVDIGAFTALIASLGVGVGLAVNGTLSNLAGGVLLLCTRPFAVDDYIEAQGVDGTVSDIRITHTKLITPDNKTIYIPNGALANGNITNYSELPIRRLDFTFSLHYDTNLEQVKDLILQVFSKDNRILAEPAPMIAVAGQSEVALQLTARAWVATSDYWPTHFALLNEIKRTFSLHKIRLPLQSLHLTVE